MLGDKLEKNVDKFNYLADKYYKKKYKNSYGLD